MDIIDHVLKCEVDPDIGGNELATLRYLAVGLHQLNANVVAIETPLRDRDKKTDQITMSFGNIPGLRSDTVQILPCFFHWYGTSVVNYARLVGFLSGLSSGAFKRSDIEDVRNFETVTRFCNAYVESIPELQPVTVWRNKVAGHFAITAPRRTKHAQDNPAFLNFSVMYPVAYEDGRFRIGVLRLTRKDKEGTTHIGELPPWSLTEVHDALWSRFWHKPLL